MGKNAAPESEPSLSPRRRRSWPAAALTAAALLATLGLPLAACRRQPRARPAVAAAIRPAAAPAAAIATPIPPPPPAARGKQLVIAYSSNLLGEYEPCG